MFSKGISLFDRIIILWNIGIKIIRGGIKSLFLQKVNGFLLIGKHVQITHGRHIICGRM